MIKEKTVLIGLGVIGLGITATTLAITLLNQPPPGVFQTSQPRPQVRAEPQGPSTSNAGRPALFGGLQGTLSQTSGGQRSSPANPRAGQPILIGGTQGYVTNVAGPDRILGPGTGVVFFSQATLPRNQSENPVAIY